MIKPYANYQICIANCISRFGPNDFILYSKNIGFALIQYKEFSPINVLDDPYCLGFIYVDENQRGEGHGKRFKNLVLKHFQIVIHTLEGSLGFFDHISKDLGLEKIDTGMLFRITFISSNLRINRKTIVNKCLGGCGLKFSGYKGYACHKRSMRLLILNTDMEFIELNKDLRFKLKKMYQSTVIHLNAEDNFEERIRL